MTTSTFYMYKNERTKLMVLLSILLNQ
ncbi:hypothetical protein CISIN_1g0353201mg, partial [Citrus sinensis]